MIYFFNKKTIRWNNISYRNRTILICFFYTGIIALLTSCVFFQFHINGRSFIWTVDGAKIEIPARIYLRQYIESIIKSIKNGAGIPVFDFNLFSGTDSMQFISVWYFEPLNFLFMFFPEKNFEIFFTFLVLIHYYLAGISFISYSRYLKFNACATLTGAFIYAFCAYALQFGVKHPVFISPMIYFPLLLIGIEKIINKKKYAFFTFIIFLTAWTSYFFLYQLSIVVFVYAIVRMIVLKKFKVIEGILLTGRAFCAYLLGVAMALVSLVPAVTGYLQSNRVASNESFKFVFPLQYYLKLPAFFIKPEMVYSFLFLGFPPLALFSFLFLWKRKKSYTAKISCCFIMLYLLIPFPSLMLNAFAFAFYRSCYIVAFSVAVITVVCYEDVIQFNFKHRFVFLVLLVLLYFIGNSNKDISGISFDFGMGLLIILYILFYVLKISPKGKK